MAISLQADSTLPQGYILVDGQRVASVSTTGGLSATLAANTVTTSSLVSGSVTTEKVAPGSITTEKLSAGAVAQSFGSTSGPFSFRNKIINGNFDIWQRGTSFTRSGGFSQPYTSDRWFAIGTASSLTVNQQPFSPGQTSVPNEPQYFCQCIVTTSPGSTSYAALGHRIENVRTLSGKTAVLTFWAKANSNKSISIEFSQHFGSGGSPSAQIFALGVQKLNLTTSWQKFTVLVSVPSIAEQTLGTNDNDHFIVGFWFDAGSDFDSRTNNLGQQSGTFDIAQVQLEEGTVATPFEQRPIGLELSLCQRYYERMYYAIPTTGFIPLSNWRVTKRNITGVGIVSYISGSGGGVDPLGKDGVYVSSFASVAARVLIESVGSEL